MPIPEHYKGREQSYVKHLLLEAYLEKLFMILGRYQSTICYVDCFAGPWEEGTDDLSDTSIAISLRIMKKCREGLKKTFNRDVTFRAFFIEIKPTSFQKLEKYLKENQFDGISAEARQGDFLQLRDAILKWCGNQFSFFFVDPTGWEEIQIAHLAPLLKRPNSEYLITFMYEFLVRFCEKDDLADKMIGMFGATPDVSGMTPQEKEHHLLSLYRENAQKHAGATSYVGRVDVLDPCIDRTKYHLVYITRHPLGLIKFMEASESVEGVQREVRAQAKQDRRVERTGQPELFNAEQAPPADWKAAAKDYSAIDGAKTYWLKQLRKEPAAFDEAALARMLHETGWFISDIQAAFADLLSEGKVKNLDAKRTRPKNPVNFKNGEKLCLS